MRQSQEEKKSQGPGMKRLWVSIVMILVGIIIVGISFLGAASDLFAGGYGIPLTKAQKISRLKHRRLYERICPQNTREFSVKAVNLLGEEARIVVTGNYPVVCDYDSSIVNPTPFPVTSVPPMNDTSQPVEEAMTEVNGIPAPPNQVKNIKDILQKFANDVCYSKPASSEQVPGLAIDEAKDTSLTSSFREMVENCDIDGIEAMDQIDRARLIDRLRDFSHLKAEIGAIMKMEASSEVEQAQQQIDLAGKLLKSVHTLRLVMDSLKKFAEKSRDGDLKHSDKYSELASRMVLRYSISKAEPLFHKYQKLAEGKIPERSENCSKSELKMKQQLGAMRTYMVATRKLYIDGGKNGRSLGVRYQSYNDKYENNINAEVAFSKLSRCFKRYSSVAREQKKIEKSVPASEKTEPAKNNMERESQSGQSIAKIGTHAPLG